MMDWSQWPTYLVHGGLIILLAALGLVVVHLVGRRSLRFFSALDRVSDARRQHVVTLIHAARWIANVAIIVTALIMLLGTFGVNITPLLASAGVAGLAVSLGAQTLIKDLLGGILVLTENQYAVGDIIQVGSVLGQVEQITLRTTHIRGTDGSLNIVPNGEVRIVANQTRDYSRALVDIGVAYEEDLDRVLTLLTQSLPAFAADPRFAPDLVAAPQVQGPMSLGDSAITVRILVNTRPGKHLEIGRELRKFVLAVCEREGVNLPYPRQELMVREQGWSEPGR
jgi:small-conductance mechanosensitive channel